MEGAILWAATLLLSFTASQDGSDLADLIRRLNHDDPVVRDAASAALRKAGSRAIPELEKALGHSSAEVRGRAARLLKTHDSLKILLNHPEAPALRRLWDAVIETWMAKRPIPAAIWKDYGGEYLREDLCAAKAEAPHEVGWILSRLREGGSRALIALTPVGVEGQEDQVQPGGEICWCTLPSLPGDLAARLLECEPDENAFEEIYATILLVYAGHHAHWLASLSLEEWGIVLRYWVLLRRKPGGKPMVLPAGRKGALTLVSRGPWVRGIASGLLREQLFNGRHGVVALLEEGRDRWEGEQPSGTKEIAAIYSRLLRLDLATLHFGFGPPSATSGRRSATHRKIWGTVDRDVLERALGNVALDDDTLQTLESLGFYLNPQGFRQDDLDGVAVNVMHVLARELVSPARAAPNSPKK